MHAEYPVSDPASLTDDDSAQTWTGLELVIASMTELIRGNREVLEMLRGMNERLQQLERRASATPPVLDDRVQADRSAGPVPRQASAVSEQALLADLEVLVRDAAHAGEHRQAAHRLIPRRQRGGPLHDEIRDVPPVVQQHDEDAGSDGAARGSRRSVRSGG
jgi:hypothetical protein